MFARYKHLFEGIGGNNKEILGQLHMKAEAVPVTQKLRQVPYYLQEALKKWLDLGIKEYMFEKVPEEEPITWCSPLVVQPKPKFAKYHQTGWNPT